MLTFLTIVFTFCLETGNINSFFTGSASMSALSATTGPGFPPLRIPTTPVLAIPVCTSIPSERRCAAIFSAVLNSRFQVQDAGESLFSNQLRILCLCFALILVLKRCFVHWNREKIKKQYC
jgi:hypothetical protein